MSVPPARPCRTSDVRTKFSEVPEDKAIPIPIPAEEKNKKKTTTKKTTNNYGYNNYNQGRMGNFINIHLPIDVTSAKTSI